MTSESKLLTQAIDPKVIKIHKFAFIIRQGFRNGMIYLFIYTQSKINFNNKNLKNNYFKLFVNIIQVSNKTSWI